MALKPIMFRSSLKKHLLIVFLILVADQGFKFWIKTHMYLGQEYHISELIGLGDWFILHFTENNGMAFGLELAGSAGKLFLSSFRIVAVCLIGWYMVSMIRKGANAGFIVSISLIFAGALGNIIDSAFYGLIFSTSDYQLATLFPPGGGYDSFLFGRVVDMLYFPIIEGHFPSWSPLWADEAFIFFRPVFNIADSAITVGIFSIILFQREHFDI